MSRDAGALRLRTVDRFEEPAFTELVAELLWEPDREQVARQVFGDGAAKPAPSQARQVRVGAFDGELLVGWSHAFLREGGVLYVANSAVRPAYRRRGVYTRLVAAVEDEARALQCTCVESHHRTSNSAVLVAKLRAGYTIVGTEFSAQMGLLVKMAKHLDARRDAVFQARAGTVEGNARLFGGLSTP